MSGRIGAVVIALFTLALVWGGILWSLAAERTATLQTAARDADNLADSFEHGVLRSLTALQQSLLSLRRSYARDPAGFDMHDWSEVTQAMSDVTAQFAVTDRHGMVVSATTAPSQAQLDLSDRPYFQALRDSADDHLVISAPQIGRLSGKSVIVAARKRLAVDGSFDGIVLVSVETDYLVRFYNLIDIGRHGAVGLTGLDGIVRARAGGAAATHQGVGQSAAGSQLMQAVARSNAGTFWTVSTLDGVKRLYGFRRVGDFPLVVTVGLAETDIISRFVGVARTLGVLGGTVTILLMAVLVLYLRGDTKARQVRATLRAQYEEKSEILQTTLENTSQGILMIGSDQRVLVANPVVVAQFELPAELMVGRPPVSEVLHWLWSRGEYEHSGDDFAECLRQFLTQARSNTVVEHIRPTGMVLEVHSRLLPKGALVRTYTDITQRKLDEAVLRASRDEANRATSAKSAFLATMSHEIRSPLSGLLGVLELLHATRLDTEQSRMAEMIRNSGQMLLAVLNDILDFSKIEAGALAIAPEPTALHALLAEMVQPHVAAGRHKGVAVTLTIDPAVPAHVTTDPLRVRQIVGNLLSNAMKFTAAGSVTVLAGLVPEADLPLLRIAVDDSGIGMSAEALARLFQPFMQADSSTTRQFGGTGLGLSISHKLAALLGGELSASSTLGTGSSFSLTLPCQACAAPAATITPRAPSATPASGQLVLLVDDDPTNRWLAERQLQQLGFTVDVAEDGEAGLAAALASSYDLVVTDLHMPRRDGISLAQALRSADDAARRDVPIIGLTADTTAEQRAGCEAAGMTAVAIKPLAAAQLAELLAGILAWPTSSAAQAVPVLQAVPFDSQIFLALFDRDDAEGAAWLRRYLDTAREQVLELKSLQAASLAQAAHRLAGASFSVGAMKLGAAARALELSADAPARAAAAVQAEFAAAASAITDFLAGASLPIPPYGSVNPRKTAANSHESAPAAARLDPDTKTPAR
jgi:signal transduction histidine kinase/DNA-binding response OmpR family regulator